MNFSKRLLLIAGLLMILGLTVLRWLDPEVSVFSDIHGPAAFSDRYQAFANGLFLVIGVFWVGAVDSVRKALNPLPFDNWLRFSGLAFAASFLLSVLLPAQSGALSGVLYLFLYLSAIPFAIRTIILPVNPWLKRLASAQLVLVAITLFEAIVTQWQPGLWLRAYEVVYVALWWLTIEHWLPASRSDKKQPNSENN